LDYNYDKRHIPVIGRERGSDDWIITTTNGTQTYHRSNMCSICRSYNPVITYSFTIYHWSNMCSVCRNYNPVIVTPVISRERGSDDWIITTTNGTHVTPVIGRERGSDDWIITTTNGTHHRSNMCFVCRSYNPIITSSFTIYLWYVLFVVVIIQSSLPVISRERGSDDWIITTTNGTYQ
jgi:hypothetical protein